MRKIFVIMIFGISIIYQAQVNYIEIIVNITEFSNDNGQIIVKLYNSKETFLKSHLERKTAKIVDGKATIIFRNIAKGVYTFSVIHDENENNEIDFNFLGIPSEDVAASNNAKGFLGPPSYEDAKFEITNKSIIQNIIM